MAIGAVAFGIGLLLDAKDGMMVFMVCIWLYSPRDHCSIVVRIGQAAARHRQKWLVVLHQLCSHCRRHHSVRVHGARQRPRSQRVRAESESRVWESGDLKRLGGMAEPLRACFISGLRASVVGWHGTKAEADPSPPGLRHPSDEDLSPGTPGSRALTQDESKSRSFTSLTP